MATMPSARWKEAPVGHTRTHAGSAQWWHCSGSEIASNLGYSPRSSTLSQLRLNSRGTLFSARQATTQALQLRHLRESITSAWRFDAFAMPATYAFLTFTKVSWKAPPPETLSQAVSRISASAPPLPATSLCHFDFLPYPWSMKTQSGRISWVTWAFNFTAPTVLATSTSSPSAIPASRAELGWIQSWLSGQNWFSQGLLVVLA